MEGNELLVNGMEKASLRYLGDGSQILVDWTSKSKGGKSLKCLQDFLLVILEDESAHVKMELMNSVLLILEFEIPEEKNIWLEKYTQCDTTV